MLWARHRRLLHLGATSVWMDWCLGGVRYRAPLRCLQFAFDKIKRWGKEHLIRCLQFSVYKIIRLTRRWMCPDPSCFFSPEQMMCQSLFTHSVGQWVIVSDFGDSYCIYQACKLVLLLLWNNAMMSSQETGEVAVKYNEPLCQDWTWTDLVFRVRWELLTFLSNEKGNTVAGISLVR